ncbi:PolC-type DNA polymerase III [Paenibacillus tarimensis]
MKMQFISDTDYTVSGVHIKDFSRQRYCIFDFEATGINHEEEYITQVGAVIFENNIIQRDKSFCTYIKSPKPIPEAVERFTGICNKDLQDAPTLSEIYSDFVEFTKDAVLVTHAGYEFDLLLLEKECERNNLPMIENQVLDTKALFSFLHPEINEIIWTDYLIRHYQINDKDLRRHDALDDSILIGRLFQCILQEYEKRNLTDIHFAEPVKVKRFQIKPLA